MRPIPSGPGQTDKVHSLSVVLASDAPPLGMTDAAVQAALTATLPQVTVGVAAVAVGSGTAAAGVIVQAQRANSVPIYVGKADVVVGAGVELGPGDSIFLEVSDVASVYAVASAANQKLGGLVL